MLVYMNVASAIPSTLQVNGNLGKFVKLLACLSSYTLDWIVRSNLYTWSLVRRCTFQTEIKPVPEIKTRTRWSRPKPRQSTQLR